MENNNISEEYKKGYEDARKTYESKKVDIAIFIVSAIAIILLIINLYLFNK